MTDTGIDLGEALRTMQVSGTSPDGHITARLTGASRLELSFRQNTYARYGAAELGRQLARLGTTMYLNWLRERRDTERRAAGLTVEEAEQIRAEPRDDQAYRDQVEVVEAVGTSPNGVVRIHTVGMTRWDVTVDADGLRRSGERAFLAEAQAGFADWFNRRQMATTKLKAEHFDLGIPREWIEAVKRGPQQPPQRRRPRIQ